MPDTNQTLTNPIFQPAMRPIVMITRAFPAVVTTEVPHNYTDNLVVSLRIPDESGMVQADGLWGVIKVLTEDTFSIDIDTQLFDVFTYDEDAPQIAQALPSGDRSRRYRGKQRNALPEE